MKTGALLGVAGIAFVSLTQVASAGPRIERGSFSGGSPSGGRVGGFAGGGPRAAPAFHGGSIRAAPAFSNSATFYAGRSFGGARRAPYYYYRSNRFTGRSFREVPTVRRPYSYYAPTRPYAERARGVGVNRPSLNSNTRAAAANRPPNRVASTPERNRISNQRNSTIADRQSFIKNHASERHDAKTWNRGWDKHHTHFHNNRVFVFIDGFWWGLDPGYYPWDYYPDLQSSPYDYYYGSPSDSYNYDPYNYDDQSAYGLTDQYAPGATIGAVQSQLAKLGYYDGAIDGTLGDETEAALAHYQEDQNLSVTGTLDTATLQSLGIR